MVKGPKTTLVLQRYTQTADGMGGFTETWSDACEVEGVLCRSILTRRRGLEQIATGKKWEYGMFTFFVDYDLSVTIDAKDRFRSQDSTEFYEVTYPHNPGNKFSHLEIELDKME